MISHFFFASHLPSGWLHVFRCGTAVLLLLTSLQLWPDFHLLYGSESVVDHRLLRLGEDAPTWMMPMGAIDRGHLVVYMMLCVLLAVGRFARLWAILLCLLHHALYMAHPAFSYGFDYVAASAIFYCCWFPVGYGRSDWVAPCLRVLQLHLCIIYLFGGLDKAIGPTWRDGEALWKALHLPDLMGALRTDIAFLRQYPAIVTALGWSVILLELAYPLCIWLRHTRRVWLWGILGVHAGIAVFMGLYHFSAVMMLFNVCAFYFPYRKMTFPAEQIASQYHHPVKEPSQRADPLQRAYRKATKPSAPSV